MSIYVLKLKGGNYWVGHTNYKIKGIHQFKGCSAWTILYEPISIHKIFAGKKNLVDKEGGFSICAYEVLSFEKYIFRMV